MKCFHLGFWSLLCINLCVNMDLCCIKIELGARLTVYQKSSLKLKHLVIVLLLMYVCVWAITFEIFELVTLFSVHGHIFAISRTCLRTKVKFI